MGMGQHTETVTARGDLRRSYLDGAGRADWRVLPLAGDASARRYFRLRQGESTCLLMDVDPASGLGVADFIRMQEWLASLGLSVPQIFDADADAGFVLIEDFGDDLFEVIVNDAEINEGDLYCAALEVLERISAAEPPGWLPGYDLPFVQQEVDICTDWYVPGAAGGGSDLEAIVAGAFAKADAIERVCVLRDYHSQNLFWLPGRDELRRVGLIDFQDARIGHPVYDLVSLLGDARRDVGADAKARAADQHFAFFPGNREEFAFASAFWGAQRNLKILGIFARLCIRDQKPAYLELMPRVWRNLSEDLRHPELADLRCWVDKSLHPPTPDYLANLRAMTCRA